MGRLRRFGRAGWIGRLTRGLISICFLCPDGYASTGRGSGRAAGGERWATSRLRSLRGVRRLKDAIHEPQAGAFISPDSIENRMY